MEKKEGKDTAAKHPNKYDVSKELLIEINNLFIFPFLYEILQ